MNKLYLTLVFLCLAITAKPQSISEYNTDLTNLHNLLMEMPSYKAQIKGENAVSFNKLYEHLLTEKPVSQFDHFYKLAQLMIPIKDNHLHFSQVPPVQFDNAQLADSNFVKAYRNSDAFKNFPNLQIDLVALEKRLLKKRNDEVEGIYYLGGDAMKMALYRTAKKDSLVGVILSTQNPNWRAGQIALVLKEFQPNRFRAYTARLDLKIFGLLRVEKFMHRMLTETGWRKRTNLTDHSQISSNELTFQFKTINSNIKYLRLGSFSSNDKQLEISQKFYDGMKDSVTAPNLIVDLRNNGGGGYKSSDKFINLLRKYASDGGHIYAIINNRTYSNAEMFIVRLKASDNVMVYGEPSNGTLSYGNNNGTIKVLPGSRFRLYITDMRDMANFVRFEDIGFAPDVLLDPAKDWVQQVIQIIKATQK